MKKITDEQYRMLATHLWVFLFGIYVGWATMKPEKLWWLPIACVAFVILARKWIHRMDKKERRRANDNSRKNR